MRGSDNVLFYQGDLDDTLRGQTARIGSTVDGINKDQLRATPEDVLVQHIVDSLAVTPLELHEDSMEMEQGEARVDVSGDRMRNFFHDDGQDGPLLVPGIRVVVSVPFSGDAMLWELKPNPWQLSFPHGEIRSPNRDGIGYLDIFLEQPTDEPPEKLKERLDHELTCVRFYVNSQKTQVEQFNSTLRDKIRQAIAARKERIRVHDGVVDLLGIPLKRRGNVPSVRPIEIARKLVRPLPPPPKSGFKPEPGISEEDYEHILSVIRHEGRTFETTPKTYAMHDEEGLRDIMLAHLNGHYEGGATGETFRRSGKTDIRIEDDKRAAFVAECKVWRGAGELTAAIDQLLGYLTWRDCKAAIVVFNKNNARFSELIDKMPEIIKSHPRFRKELQQKGAGEWRYVLCSVEDELREVVVNVFVFNLFVA